MIKFSEYDSLSYPLYVNKLNDLPEYMIEFIMLLNDAFDIVIRGGMAYVAISKEHSYGLKDIDLAVAFEDKERLLSLLNKNGYKGYLNHNAFGKEVITIFWKCDERFNKVDILMVERLPDYRIKTLEGFNGKFKVMEPACLMIDRISKIAEWEKRNHNLEKTAKHIAVVIELSRLILNDEVEIHKELLETEIVRDKIAASISAVQLLIPEYALEYQSFIDEMINYLEV
jgi:hypothetical protein